MRQASVCGRPVYAAGQYMRPVHAASTCGQYILPGIPSSRRIMLHVTATPSAHGGVTWRENKALGSSREEERG